MIAKLPSGIRFMIGAAFAFSVMSLLVKVAGQRLPSQEIVLARAVISLGLCHIGLRRLRVPVLGRHRAMLLVRGVIGFLALSAFYYALTKLPLAETTVIQYTNPIFTALFAAWFLSEPSGRAEVVSLVLSLTGVLLIARPAALFGGNGAGLDMVAVGVALAGAVLSGLAYVIVRRLSATEHPLVIVWYFAAVSIVGSAPWVVAQGIVPTPFEWLLLLGVGISTQFGQVWLTRGLKREKAGRAMTVAYLQIVFAAGWGALFFREYPDAWSWTGGALIVAGTAIIGRAARRQARAD